MTTRGMLSARGRGKGSKQKSTHGVATHTGKLSPIADLTLGSWLPPSGGYGQGLGVLVYSY